MHIRVNDEPRDCPAGITVAELLARMGLGGRPGLAVAVNEEVVPAQTRESRNLAPGDAVLIIQAVQGG
jgi:sulfur carrier protein